MTDPYVFEEYTGFTEREVKELCGRYGMGREAFIPNREIIEEFENAMSVGGWPEILLVGINYDANRVDKPHSCIIERAEKLSG